VYSHYEHTPLSGWERSDALTFTVPSLSPGESYQEEVGLRISSVYPFMGISMIVRQTAHPSGTAWRDTLYCQLTDTLGNAVGQGVGQFQYRFPLKVLTLDGDTALTVTIHHDMAREILPGIADVGFVVSRQAY
jgi:gliding motility-associated lipoprotein GldH